MTTGIHKTSARSTRHNIAVCYLCLRSTAADIDLPKVTF